MLYPNLYTIIVGAAGVGKSRAINASLAFTDDVELHRGPTSMTMAVLTEHIVEAKRIFPFLPGPALEYNSIYIAVPELGSFLPEWDKELIGGLTDLYDVTPYSRSRKTTGERTKIERPQVNALVGGTPSGLVRLVPDHAWEEGFSSRLILIYSDQRPQIDVFNTSNRTKPTEMILDLKAIFALHGQIGWTEEYATAMHNWKLLGFPPVPEHPKLSSYCARRFSHLIKLSMVASVDRGSDLTLNKSDFNRAFGWLVEAESAAPEIFRIGSTSGDAKVMDEIYHFVVQNKRVNEAALVRYARRLLPAYAVINVLSLMERGGMIRAIAVDGKTNLRTFIAE